MCNKIIFMPATKGVYIHPSCTSPAANNIYIGPHKVTFYRCFVVGCKFLWLLSYIYKPLDIIEIMSNCNNNNQRPWLLKYIFRFIYYTQEFALQNKQKGRIFIIFSIHLFAGMAVYFIFFSVCYIFSLIKNERVRTYVFISQFSTRISAVGFRLFLKNCCSYSLSKTPLVAGILLCGC